MNDQQHVASESCLLSVSTGYRSTLKLALVMLCAASMLGCSKQPAEVASSVTSSAASPQGDTYDSVKLLPDWSGVWVLYMGQKAGGNDTVDANGQTILTPKYAELQAKARAAHAQANMSNCLPAGATAILQHGVLYEFLFTPGRVTMLFEDGEVRRIYTDGRPHLSLDDLSQSFMGDSVGHWEGKTLVVDTIGFPYGELWQNNGVRATKHTHLVERIFLNDQGRIQIDNVMTDPEVFAKPYSYSREYQRTELPLTEPVCAQNNRDTGTSLDLTPPPEE